MIVSVGDLKRIHPNRLCHDGIAIDALNLPPTSERVE
jgi:hypothetical protein